jgi:hypothetical protein
MVEIYFNAQSDNGTLTRGELSTPSPTILANSWRRPCVVEVVQPLSSSDASVQGSTGSVATRKLDEKCWIPRRGIEASHLAHVWMVKGKVQVPIGGP